MKTKFYTQRGTTNKTVAVIAITALIVTLSFFASCDADPIFAAIEDETTISKGTIKGSVSSLIVVGSDLWATDGNIYRRSGGDGPWNEQEISAHRCSQLATDGTHVYALMQDKDWKFDSLQRFDGTSWSPVSGVSDVGAIFSGDDFIFAISNSGTASTITEMTVAQIAIDIANPKGSAVVGANTYFATATQVYTATATQVYTAAGTPVTGAPTANIIGLASNDTNLYVLTSGKVHRLNGATWTDRDHSVGGASSIAWLGGKNLLLIGGSKGYGEMLLDDDGKMSGMIEPGSLDLSSVKPADINNYKNSIGNSTVSRIFAITNPAPSGNDYVIYANVSKNSDTRLWSYYNNTRSIWDRE